TMADRETKALKIFYCYAHEDSELRDELAKHLSPLRRVSQITGWFDRNIRAGMNQSQEIEAHFHMADIILILINHDVIAGDYRYDTEMKRTFERHRPGSTHVLPILVRLVYWQDTPISALPVLPTNGMAITLWENRDAAFVHVVHRLRIV